MEGAGNSSGFLWNILQLVIVPEIDETPDSKDKEESRIGEACERRASEDRVDCWEAADAHEDDADALYEETVGCLSNVFRVGSVPPETCQKNKSEYCKE